MRTSERARQIGFGHYLVKPLAIAELLVLIDQHEPLMNKHHNNKIILKQ